MPKAILEFDLPEEKEEFDLANNGLKYYCFIVRLQREVRVWYKYGHEFGDVDEVIEAFRNLVFDIDLD